jgi:hypothetical protein
VADEGFRRQQFAADVARYTALGMLLLRLVSARHSVGQHAYIEYALRANGRGD